MMERYDILCFGDFWDEQKRRRQLVMIGLSNYAEVGRVMYVCLPLTLTSLVKLLMGRALPKIASSWKRIFRHGFLCKTDGVYVLTPIVIMPFLPYPFLQRLGDRLNYYLQRTFIKYYTRRLGFRNIILWVTHPFAQPFLDWEKRRLICYDRTEDFPELEEYTPLQKTWIKERDEDILKEADVVFTQTTAALERLSKRYPQSHLMPNALEPPTPDVVDNGPPKELDGLSRPYIGFSGTLGSRINSELLRHIAQKHPEWSIILVGQVYPVWRAQATKLSSLPNVHLLGLKPRWQLWSYLKVFDVCLIPFVVNPFTNSESPLKLFDYLSAGKPIVSTNLSGVSSFKNVVRIAHTKEEFVSNIEAALKEKDGELVRLRKELAAQNTWDIRARQMLEIIKSCWKAKAKDFM